MKSKATISPNYILSLKMYGIGRRPQLIFNTFII